jgi:hypothetical protein
MRALSRHFGLLNFFNVQAQCFECPFSKPCTLLPIPCLSGEKIEGE